MEPLCFAPIFKTKRFLLVGDHKQLPPLVTSDEAKSVYKADVSLFENLAVRFPVAVSTLKVQYRMDKQIMDLANWLVYGGQLKMGNSQNSKPAHFSNSIEFIHVEEKEIQREHSSKIKRDISSEKEAVVVSELVEKYRKNYDIGVITPFNRQVLKIKCQLSTLENVEVNTIDRYQGRDKSVIIISFAQQFKETVKLEKLEKSEKLENSSGNSSSILNDIRRLNVAITRAKHKLVLVGNKHVLKDYDPILRIMNYLKVDGLEKDSLKKNCLNENGLKENDLKKDCLKLES
jgi:DNA replication ATP-dependent helicase Dna2